MTLRLKVRSKLTATRKWLDFAIRGGTPQTRDVVARLPRQHIDPAWEKTIEIAYERSLVVPHADSEWNNALDTKAVQIFSVGAILIAVSGLRLNDPQWWWQPWTFVLAVVAFLMAALNCYRVYRPIGLAVAPDPKTTVDPELLALTPAEYRRQAIEDLAQDHDGNHLRLVMKAAQVRIALQCAAAELLLLVASLFRFEFP